MKGDYRDKISVYAKRHPRADRKDVTDKHPIAGQNTQPVWI